MCVCGVVLPCVYTHAHTHTDPSATPRLTPKKNTTQHTHQQNNHDKQIVAPEKFTREEARRLMALAAQHERHGWEAVAREMATGHSAIQVLIG